MLGLDLSWEAHRPYSTMSPLVCQLYSKDCIHPVTSNCPEIFWGFPHSTLYGFKTRGENCVSLCMSSLVRADCGWWDHRNGVYSYANTSWSPPLHWKASSGTVTAPGLCCISVKKQYCSGDNSDWPSWSWPLCLVGNQHRQQAMAVSPVTATHNVTGLTPARSVSQIRPISVPR